MAMGILRQILAVLFLVSTAFAYTVTGPVINAGGSAATTRIEFWPKSTPFFSSTNLVIGQMRAAQVRNGTFSITLQEGRYAVKYPPLEEEFDIYVPTGTGTNTLAALQTNVFVVVESSQLTGGPFTNTTIRASGGASTKALRVVDVLGVTQFSVDDEGLWATNLVDFSAGSILGVSADGKFIRFTGDITNNTAGNAATATTANGISGGAVALVDLMSDTNALYLLTNYLAQFKARSLDLTNGGWITRFATNVANNTSNFLISVWPQGAEIPGSGWSIRVGATEGDNNLMELLVNPRHGSASGEAGSVDANEIQFTTAGHIAHSPGYQSGRIRHNQIGIGLQNRRTGGQTFNAWAYRQACTATNGEPGYSYADTWRCITPAQDFYPGIIGRSWTNNVAGFGGYYDLALLQNLNVAVGSKWDDWDITNVVNGAGVYVFTNGAMNGFYHRGAFVQSMKSTTASGTAIPLSFGDAAMQRVTTASSSLSFYTTNVLAFSTNYQRCVFMIPGSGLNVTSITYPSWLVPTNVSAPAGVPQGYFLRLEVESFGIGDTNKTLLAAQVGPDPTFSFDSDAQNFFNRAGGLASAIESNSINNLVLNLKATNLWTKLDAYYPYAGTTDRINTNNLKSSSFGGVFTGSPAFTDGFVADGSNDYMATRFVPSTAGGNYSLDSAHIAVYLESATIDDTDRPIGVYDSAGGVKHTQLRRNSTTIQVSGPNGTTYLAGAGFSGVYDGFWAGSRTNSTHATVQLRETAATGAQASSALPTKQFYIGANNNDGTAASFSAAAIRCASIGGGLTPAELNALKWCMEQYIAQMP